MSARRRGDVEAFIDAQGRPRFRARVRLSDGSRISEWVPVEHCQSEEMARRWAMAVQKSENNHGLLQSRKNGQSTEKALRRVELIAYEKTADEHAMSYRKYLEDRALDAEKRVVALEVIAGDLMASRAAISRLEALKMIAEETITNLSERNACLEANRQAALLATLAKNARRPSPFAPCDFQLEDVRCSLCERVERPVAAGDGDTTEAWLDRHGWRDLITGSLECDQCCAASSEVRLSLANALRIRSIRQQRLAIEVINHVRDMSMVAAIAQDQLGWRMKRDRIRLSRAWRRGARPA